MLTQTSIFMITDPHIGHLYTAFLADAAHRWQKLTMGTSTDKAILSTGTDEHGLKVQRAATESGMPTQSLCDLVSQRFRALFDAGNIDYTHFIRTTDETHERLVQSIWLQLHDKGYLCKSTYEGWYSVPDETFLLDSQLTDGDEPGSKVSKETGHKCEWSLEENYMFKLSLFRERLLKWITKKPYPIIPDYARHFVIGYLTEEGGLNDLSVSRPLSRLQWGIRVPNDEEHTVYVWLDALVNYLTVSGYPNPGHLWPATDHVIGKDIMKFHCIYWPSFLMALDVELPSRIVVHSHWTMDKSKMSKSKGNVVDPFDRLETHGADKLRYFLLKEGSLHHDGDYHDSRLAQLANADLADTFGNLLSRATATKLHPPEIKLCIDPNHLMKDGKELLESLQRLSTTVNNCYSSYEFGRGISSIMECLHMANRFFGRHKPWTLVPNPDSHAHLGTVLAVSMETLRLCSILLSPIIPDSSSKILQRLGMSSESIGPEDLKFCMDRDFTGAPIVVGGSPMFSKKVYDK
ncbi:PREDICTED: methionine--tRNA ligase, mitochondrial-like isoform X2 [Amphimedon queenslandica]|uniref:Methionine--tRNA ligase, mitochondrial n=1 Tax=Amphimedon queenslandica TaxID=400682 RepID=A0A1X7UCT1_AMPQE|nr:PREDICTED: methionine--tRNA ligase, mitochondrial-like isoform X2 [Amphimedon queenslandica]|eukprot:XP_019855020.1 PREDICTED: methionine--tRNA ligase, mitochondrial-like isoform X2 [Amphimedon queenslandica]